MLKRSRVEFVSDVWRPTNTILETLGDPQYLGNMRSGRWQEVVEGNYATALTTTLSCGAWCDVFIGWYATWDQIKVNAQECVYIRTLSVWDLETKYIVGLGLECTGDMTEAAYKAVQRKFWRDLSMDKNMILHIKRQARRLWAHSSSGIIRGNTVLVPAPTGVGKGSALPFHAAMVNYMLDEDNAEYRVQSIPQACRVRVIPLGLEHLINQHVLTHEDCFSPLFMGKRNATTHKRVWAGPDKGSWRTHNHVLYFEVM